MGSVANAVPWPGQPKLHVATSSHGKRSSMWNHLRAGVLRGQARHLSAPQSAFAPNAQSTQSTRVHLTQRIEGFRTSRYNPHRFQEKVTPEIFLIGVTPNAAEYMYNV